MGYFTEENTYHQLVEKYEETDEVRGGLETSPDNLPLKKIVNRTNWLYNTLNALKTSYEAFYNSMTSIYYSKTEINAKFSDLVNGAPGILDTLSEIASALGNDANLAATLTNTINNEVNARVAAINSEAQSRTNADNDIKNNTLGGVKIKTVDLGSWNMDADQTKEINHGLDGTKILFVKAKVFGDAGSTTSVPFFNGLDPNTYYYINQNTITLLCSLSGAFDNEAFSSTAINRGEMTVFYTD